MKKGITILSTWIVIFALSACGLITDDNPECTSTQLLKDGQCVEAEDTTSPSISGAEDQTIYEGETIDLLDGVYAYDDIDGNVTSSLTTIGTVETSTAGTYTIVYTAEDSSGNIEEVTITVTVLVDDNIPTANVRTLSNSDFAPLNTVRDEFVALQATMELSDTAYDGPASIALISNPSNWGGFYVIMEDPVNVVVYDAISLYAQIPDTVAYLTFKLEDGTNNASVNLMDYKTGTDGDWSTFVVPSIAFTDIDLSALTVIGFWNAKDSNGDYIEETMLFDNLEFFTNTSGEDTTSPVISGATDTTYYLDDTVDLLAGISAMDNVDGNITGDIIVDGTVDSSTLGVYPVSYTVTDAAGNTTVVAINITVAEAPAAVTVADIINSDFTILNGITDEIVALQSTIALSMTAYDGDSALQMVLPGGNWGGAYVAMETTVDVSMYNTITLVAQVPTDVDSLSIKLEDGTNNFYVNLLDYATGSDGDWTTYEIPTSDFTDLDFSSFKTIGFWNARDIDSNFVAANILIDNIQFENIISLTALFSTNTTLFDGISGSFAPSNSATVDLTTDTLDGDMAVLMMFDGLSWGGIYAGLSDHVDASSYINVVFSMKANAAVESLVVKLEDGTNNNFVNISDYTPTIDGDWVTYTIPLADFAGVDFSLFKVIGFWHPKDADGNYIACEIIFDNLYFS